VCIVTDRQTERQTGRQTDRSNKNFITSHAIVMTGGITGTKKNALSSHLKYTV
jgi:hypothetical protein